MAVKNIPAIGELMDVAPFQVKMLKVTVGPTTDYDCALTTAGDYPIINVAAGTVIWDVKAMVKTAGSDNTVTIGDCDNADGFWSDTTLIPDTTTATWQNCSTAGKTYATGVVYTAANVIKIVGATATNEALVMDLYFLYSRAGSDTN